MVGPGGVRFGKAGEVWRVAERSVEVVRGEAR